MFGWNDQGREWLPKEIENDLDIIYDKRICVIFSCSDMDFGSKILIDDTRYGDRFDRVGLIHVMIKLNYHVKNVVDFTANEIKKYIENLCQNPDLKDYESITLFILSHGNKNGVIFGSDGEPVYIMDDILVKLNESPYLKRKEKIIFINACRGGIDILPC